MTEDLFRIGAVAKRTGITPECLRAWERRYGLEPAERAGKTRFYDAAQIERLLVIKALLDQGHPISQIIHLPADALQRRLAPRHVAPSLGAAKVALVGTPLVRAYHDAQDKQLEVVGEWASSAEMYRDALPTGIECVVAYLPSLALHDIERIGDFCPAARIVVVFKYATAADLAAVRDAGHPLLRWPAEWRRVEELVAEGAVFGIRDHGRRYSDEELLHISLMASRAACDCPRHLATLIGELNDYATHARRCRGDDRHDGIESDVHAARAYLERALQGQVEEHRLLVTAN